MFQINGNLDKCKIRQKQIQKYDLTSFLKKLQLLIDITAQRNVIASCNKTNGCTQEKFYKWYFENIKSFAVMCQF